MADVYHTFFGIAGLALMGYEGLESVDATFALPTSVVQRLKQRREASATKPV
jgi:geranylgeranyl transferase type-2 subunit beta